jgi:hypothetical protein
MSKAAKKKKHNRKKVDGLAEGMKRRDYDERIMAATMWAEFIGVSDMDAWQIVAAFCNPHKMMKNLKAANKAAHKERRKALKEGDKDG